MGMQLTALMQASRVRNKLEGVRVADCFRSRCFEDIRNVETMPQSAEEKKIKKKLAQRKRIEKIKQDPDKYALYRLKEKERYLKKKKEGKIKSIANLMPKEQKLIRKKNREASKRYYAKKMQKRKINVESEEEIIIDESVSVKKNVDPLCLELPSSPVSIIPRSPEIPSTSKILPQSPIPSSRITRSTIRQNRMMGIDLHLTENDTDVISNVDASYTIVNSPTPNTLDQISESDLPRTPSPLSCILSSPFRHAASPQSSIVSSPSTHISSPKISCPRPAKKKSPWKHILRKFQYRYNKELKLKDQKIQELKRINQNCLKRIQRLQRDKIIRDLNKKNHNLSIIEQKSQLPIEPCHAEVKNIVKKYFEDDENSRMCAGKKEFVTKGKIKKQKKYLTDSLLNLHNKYIKNYPQYKLSYSAFCKLRPFWIRIPNVNSRETCKDHENMDLVVLALRQNNLIVEKSVNEVLQTLCCDPRNINCLAKNCDSCKHKVINYKEFDNSKEAYYWIWNKIKKTYIKDQKEKTTLQTIKEKVAAYPKDIINHFEKLLVPYMLHCRNIIAQYDYTKKIKQNLKPEECIIHCDFSENYNTKYASEIQSFHFGSSRQQITLHTSVIYYIKNDKQCKQSFCTISECLRHDAIAIWEHLMPILRFLEKEVPCVTRFYFISDSPSAQYRNRKMFYIMAKMHWYLPNLRLLVWNYSEKGHGKGAPDGVGGVLKRTADQIVSRGHDIPNMQILVSHLKEACPGVILEGINESDILQKDMLIPKNLKDFRGTMKTHQVVWSANNVQNLAMRELSCSLDNCSQDAVKCSHGLHLGFYNIIDSHYPQNSSNQEVSMSPKKYVYSTNTKIKKRSAAELEIPDDDSFWAETSSVDIKVITPKFTSRVLSSLHNIQNLSELSDSDSDDIFYFKKPQGEKKKVKKELVAHDMTSPSTSEDVKKRHREVRHNLFDDDSENLAPSEKPKKYFF